MTIFSTQKQSSSTKQNTATIQFSQLLSSFLFVSNLTTFNSSLAQNNTTTTNVTMAAKLSADLLFQMAKVRRSIYTLNKDLPISTTRIHEIVKDATLHTPSSFNSQTNRAVVLFGGEHEKLWDLTSETLKAIVPAENFKATADKLALFKGAAGTVLFFEDTSATKALQDKFALYADRFPTWAVHSLGMEQLLVWTALELEGLGANLQHYNPLIDEKVAAAWKIPATWRLDAQLVFGGKSGEAGPKEFQNIDERVKVYGA